MTASSPDNIASAMLIMVFRALALPSSCSAKWTGKPPRCGAADGCRRGRSWLQLSQHLTRSGWNALPGPFADLFDHFAGTGQVLRRVLALQRERGKQPSSVRIAWSLAA
jgi:hypothetical protein